MYIYVHKQNSSLEADCGANSSKKYDKKEFSPPKLEKKLSTPEKLAESFFRARFLESN